MHQLFYLNIPYFIIYKVYFDSQTFLLCYFSCNEEWLHQQGFCNHLYPEVIYHLWKDIMGWLPLLMRLPLPCCELMFDHSSSDLRAELSWRPHNLPCDGTWQVDLCSFASHCSCCWRQRGLPRFPRAAWCGNLQRRKVTPSSSAAPAAPSSAAPGQRR